MSTKGKRDFRPLLHFTPRSGWINDPNGLVFADGKYHLFAQYYPEPYWGPMHWYHAVSSDLIHWSHLPVALEPDELGYIFSGSAVYDRDNSSGLGSKGNPPIVAMYTSHLHRGKGDIEQESIASSTDGVHFEKYPGNPVIPSDMRDFRDPKIIENPIRGGWTVLLAAGDRIVFYFSRDLKNWEKTGEFGPEGNYSDGVWECPDLFTLKTPSGEEKWVLLVSMGTNHANHGARTQYFIGTFDGDKFICTDPFDKAEFIDMGYDSYAGVTYHNTAERLLIAWGTSWVYAVDLPTGEYCGAMTLARRLSLEETEKGGLRLIQTPIDDNVFEETDEVSISAASLPGEVFKLTVKGSGASETVLSNSLGQRFRFGVNDNGEFFIDRTLAGEKNFNKDFADDWYGLSCASRFYGGDWELTLIFDRSITEIYADGGSRVFTSQIFPDIPYDRFAVSGNAKVYIQKLKEDGSNV